MQAASPATKFSIFFFLLILPGIESKAEPRRECRENLRNNDEKWQSPVHCLQALWCQQRIADAAASSEKAV
ncbi:hypothetical protein KCP69_19590 [Salmonella enterica subsp. enterica]|nr:hypothetical protein KCP69_19590 [Salmonella enterica subsp. enterica]